VTLGLPSPSHAYRTLADVEGEPTEIVWASVPVAGVDLSAGFPESLAASVAIELERAAAEWNGVPCAGRIVTADPSAVAPAIGVRYVRGWVDAGFGAEASASTDVVLQSGPTAAVTVVRATIHLNADMRWFGHDEPMPPSGRDLRAVLVHELGHALGLAHPCEIDHPDSSCGPEHDGVAMHPVYSTGTYTRLSTDDVAGVCELYGARVEAAAACERTQECMEAEWCQDGRCTADLAYGDTCSGRSDCSSSYCIESSESVSGGLCTHTCVTAGECPSGTECAPLAASDLSVCRPLGTAATCSTSPAPRRSTSPLFVVLCFALFLRKPTLSKRSVR